MRRRGAIKPAFPPRVTDKRDELCRNQHAESFWSASYYTAMGRAALALFYSLCQKWVQGEGGARAFLHLSHCSSGTILTSLAEAVAVEETSPVEKVAVKGEWEPDWGRNLGGDCTWEMGPGYESPNHRVLCVATAAE